MSLKKIKKVLAQVLILTLLVPNLTVGAEESDTNINVQEQTTNQIINDTSNEQSKNENFQINAAQEEILKNTISDDIIVEDKVGNETQDAVQPKVNENSNEDAAIEDNKKSVAIDKEVTETSIVGEEYKAKEVDIQYVETNDEDFADKIEYKLKMEALSKVTVLETKTEAEYEVALAHEDGTFTYVSSTDSVEEAVKEVETLSEELEKDPEGTVDKLTNMSSRKSTSSLKFKKLNTSQSSTSALVTIINSKGQVIYSTNAMARIIKYINGTPYMSADKTINLYSDSGLTKTTTYINHMYVEDAPILEDAGNSAKILVSSTEAWINKNTSSSEYDMVVVPLNQVKNPSYYIVQDGELKHFISSDITGTSGYTITIGKAPSYLTAGVRYFSYDGIYFYDGQDIQLGLDTLINDYKRGSRGNAVNGGNPFYLYYNYLPFRSKTIYTAEEIDNFINANTAATSKLRGLGSTLKDSEQRYGVNAILALGIAINESAWGNSTIAQTKNNLFGINAVDSNPGQAANEFSSPAASVIEFTKNYISRGYADPADWRYNGGFLGNKKNGANIRYASDPFWGEKASQYAYRIDKYLSGTIDNLKDTNVYQIAITTSNNKVMKSDGSLLYNITDDKNQYSGYIETPFIITKTSKVTINGQSTYEIWPERNTPVNNGGTANKFSGDYDWLDKGYIINSGIKFLNEIKSGTLVQPSLMVRAGSNRYETAVEISKSKFSSADTVVLVNGYALVDGLASTPVAAYYKGPLLLTQTNSLGSATKAEIQRLKAKKVIIVGGSGVITSKVVNELKDMGISNITRLGGNNRYDTALEVAKYIDKNLYDVSNVVITSGFGEADAMSIAPVSGRDRMPILLVEKDNIPSSVNTWLSSEKLESAYIIGGTGVVSSTVMTKINSITSENISLNRLGGSNRYETNALIIERFYSEALDTVILSKGVELIDALAVGPLAALNDYPVVLAGTDLTGEQKYVLGKRTATRVYQAGYGVSSKAISSLRQSLAYYKY